MRSRDSQEGAVVGYNPKKPGRPSHTYHSYLIANLRLVLEVDVKPGDQIHSSHSLPGLVELIQNLPEDKRPVFVRGDCDWGNETVMSELEAITTRPLLLSSVGRMTESGRQKRLVITDQHTKAEGVEQAYRRLSQFFTQLKADAPQLSLREYYCKSGYYATTAITAEPKDLNHVQSPINYYSHSKYEAIYQSLNL